MPLTYNNVHIQIKRIDINTSYSPLHGYSILIRIICIVGKIIHKRSRFFLIKKSPLKQRGSLNKNINKT